MILSTGRQYLFIHAPKTGGTSMALALEARAMKDDVMLGDTPKAVRRRHRLKDVQTRGRLWKHATLADLDGLVTPQMLAELFVFTLVRNPWDRVVSYYHWLRAQSFDHTAVQLAQNLSFHDFVLHPQTRASLRGSQARHYITDASGGERCNLFIRLEHLATDIAPLEAHLGFALDLPHANRSSRDVGYRGYYTPDSQAAVAEACTDDIERFRYSFDPA
ncbi:MULTISPECIES: sulfotransferase family 2 domain-containing protein [Roseobacteraceae]|uniref:Sulfotransferase family protein n=1 Tax=Pseudosulfitobacter pseudonitzschiae TaxID=1402135 RepID=A0A221K2D3_9RHOB|nr:MULTISPECIES: sulfotransferase family 2 domain-containing protein [Roseobacteraceae]ASM73144.1 sulfotransferase family protein [Pseudosulfitobacter pseudonitzschiae]